MAPAMEAERADERQTSPAHEEHLLHEADPEAMLTSPGPSAAASAFSRKVVLAGSVLLGLMGCAGLALGAHAASLKHRIVAEHMLQEYDDKHLCSACSGGTCSCGWATPDKCASRPQNSDCCYDCCCSAHQMHYVNPGWGHFDNYHGSRIPVDPFYGHGDSYHGSRPPACKYSVGSQVFVHGQDGGWHHATVSQLLPGCQYKVRLSESVVHNYPTTHHWWSLHGPSWWLIVLVVLAIVAVIAIFLMSSKKK